MQVQDIPAVFFRSVLYGGRWPLTATGSLLGRGNGDGVNAWPPTVAYEAFEASSKQAIGSLLHHDGLVEEGQAQQAKVDKLRKAMALEAVASQQKADADHDFETRRQADAERREEARVQAQERKAELNNQKGRQHAKEEKKASDRTGAAERATERIETAVTKQERAAASTRVSEERRAVSKQRQAVSAEAKAADIERQVESTRSTRKANRKSP